jgi:hypothetical protein
MERIADSLPEPGPLTKTSTSFTPRSSAFFAALSAAMPAAKGVDFFEPLKPELPVDAHVSVLPSLSVMVTMVLLNDASMWAMPLVTVRNNFLLFLAFGFFCSTYFFLFIIFYLRLQQVLPPLSA